MIQINGSLGEGGGQILRSSLSLSMITKKPFTIEKIRAKRKKPGIMRQHLVSIQAAKKICNAEVYGAEMGSDTVTFIPGDIKAGEYQFSIGTAGSTTLVFQTILPALLSTAQKSKVTLIGGTHNQMAPPFDFLKESFLPIIRKMGADISIELKKYGFYPAGGGKFVAEISPIQKLQPLCLKERGAINKITVKAIVSNLSTLIAQKEIGVLMNALHIPKENCEIVTVESQGPGNIVFVKIETDTLTELFTGFGEKGVPAKKVAQKCASFVKEYLSSETPVGHYLADQLLIPFILAGEGSFYCTKPSLHTSTNCEIIALFIDKNFSLKKRNEKVWEFNIS